MSAALDSCDIAAVGMVEATLDEIATLRKSPGPGHRQAVDASCLKYADEHTVVGLGAMLQALRPFPLDHSFAAWGVVAAPRWQGRIGTANAMLKYRQEGPRSISPWLIPNLCLHAMSGTISLALGMRGLNFGVGGGLASVADGLLAGLVVQLENDLPGTWLVLSEWDTEPLGPAAEQSTPVARAVALALVSPGTHAALGRLRLQPAEPSSELACPRLADLSQFLSEPPAPGQTWSCRLDWGMDLVLTGGAA